jgi:hypothetical protein
LKETERTLSESGIFDARKETIVNKSCDLFDVGGYCLGETFIVTDLAEEFVAVDNDNFPA